MAKQANYLLDLEEAEVIACDPAVKPKDRLLVAKSLGDVESYRSMTVSTAIMGSLASIELANHISRITNKPVAVATQTRKRK